MSKKKIQRTLSERLDRLITLQKQRIQVEEIAMIRLIEIKKEVDEQTSLVDIP